MSKGKGKARGKRPGARKGRDPITEYPPDLQRRAIQAAITNTGLSWIADGCDREAVTRGMREGVEEAIKQAQSGSTNNG